MTRQKSRATFVALAIAGVVLGPTAASGAQAVGAQVVEAEGVDLLRLTASPGQLTHVRVRVKVPQGSSAEAASRQALWARGAVPLRELGTDHSRRGALPKRSGPPVARFDPADSTFTATPWPSDRFADFSESFPNPGSNAFLSPYLSYTDRAIEGFSRNGAVFFGLTAAIDAATLPSAADAIHDPRAGAQLVDLTEASAEYGRRIPVEFRQRDGAHDPYFPGDTLVMRPVNGFPLADDHTYCGLLTRRLKDRSGLPLQRDAAFGRALAEEASLAPLRSWLHGQPLAGEVVVATCFRTQDATGELQRIEQFLSHHPTSALYGVERGRSNPAFHEILARYRAPNFQSGTAPYVTTGGDVVFGPNGQPVVQRQEELRVRLVVPRNRAMPAKGWPVVLYSHGTGGDWASCLDIVGDVVGRGLAMICIDQPFHGARGTGIDPAAVTFNLFNPAAARTNFRQGALDTSFLGRMVADGRFDLAAGDAGVSSAARLDPGTVVQFGHSQGAITGTIALGADPRLDAAVLSAPAGVFSDVGFLQRPDQEILRLVLGIILGIPQDHVDAFHPVATLFQTVWDAADPVNYSPYWVGRDVLLTAGTEDPFSLVAAANAVAAAGGVPVLQPLATPSAAHDLRGLAPVSLPVSGNLPGSGGERATGGLHQRLGGDHFIAFSDKDTRALWRTFVHSLATTDPPVIGAGDQPPPGNPPPPPAHDSFAAAVPIDAMPFSTIAATRSASVEEGEPRLCGEVGATVWYQFTADDDVHVDLDTFGSDFDTVLAVYAGDTIGDLAPIACSDDAAGRLSSRVIFEASAERTYRVQVGGFGGEHGWLVLSGQTFSLPPPPPPPPPPTALENDHFDDALVISALPFSDVKFTQGAGVEPGEPQPCGEIGSTVWYRFTPQTTTTVEVNTTGSDFDTVLAVYTGDAIDQLAVLDCIDDSGGTLQSQVVFEASAGSTYWIQAGGFAGQLGELRVQASSGEA